jgi:hypothetical protein
VNEIQRKILANRRLCDAIREVAESLELAPAVIRVVLAQILCGWEVTQEIVDNIDKWA